MHAQFLANKIVALGGEPTTKPRPVPKAKTNRQMLEAVLDAEKQATADYSQRAKQAERIRRQGPGRTVGRTWYVMKVGTLRRPKEYSATGLCNYPYNSGETICHLI